MSLKANPLASVLPQLNRPWRVSWFRLPLAPRNDPSVATSSIFAPFGASLWNAPPLKLMLLFSSGRQSSLASPFKENSELFTTVFNCELIKLIAAAHCAGVAGAAQLAGFASLPPATPIKGLFRRFSPWDLPSAASTFKNQNSLSGKMDPPALPPP